MTKRTQLSKQIGIAICNADAQASLTTGRLQLFPEGKFTAPEGSMLGLVGPWFIDEQIAAAAIERIQQYENDIVVDYEHQTLLTSQNGMPAPAAGWIKRKDIKWVAGKGLVAENVEWTEEAKELIKAGKYKYFSPVFSFNKTTGHVLDLRLGALTNNPAIKNMEEALAAASAQFFPNQNNQEDASMPEELLKLLGLKKDASEEDAVAALTSAHEQITNILTALGVKDAQGLAALSEIGTTITGLQKKVEESETAIAAASAATPAKALTVINELTTEVAALKSRLDGNDKDTLIAAAKAQGKLTPAMEEWAKDQTIEVLQGFIKTAAPIAALTGKQTEGQEFDKDGNAVLSDEQLAVCTAMGIKPEDFKSQLPEAK